MHYICITIEQNIRKMKKYKSEYLPRLSKSKDFQKNYNECCQIEEIITKQLKNKHEKRIGDLTYYSTISF